MTEQERLELLKKCQARASRLCFGDMASKLKGDFQAKIDVMSDAEKREASEKKVFELLQRARKERIARNFEGEAQQELNALRVTTVEQYLMANANALSFFQTVSLADDEEPWIEYAAGRHELGVRYIGNDGKPKKSQNRKSNTGVLVDLFNLWTDDFEYPVRDIRRGDVRAAALANIDMADDMTQKIDAILWPYITDFIGTFPNNTYRKHSRVVSANIPGTNLLEPTLENGDARDGDSNFDLACFKSIIKYNSDWGSNAFKDGELKATVVIMPSSDLTGWLNLVQLTTDAKNMVIDQIFEAGYVVSFGGQTLTFIGDNTLDPAAGRAYVRSNKAIGEFFTKPGMAEVDVDDSREMRRQNRESIAMGQVIGAGTPYTKRVNVAAVQYRLAS